MPVSRLHCIYKLYVDFLNTESAKEQMAGEEIQEQMEDAGLTM